MDNRVYQAEVQADTKEARDAHIQVIPTFFFYGPVRNDVVLGAEPFATFQALIDSLLPDPTNGDEKVSQAVPL